MKNTIFLAIAALLVGSTVNAQSTVDSITAKYKMLPMPGALTLEKTFPVLGSYQLNNTTDSAASLTVTIDSASKGIVWVEGLPQGRIKAYLKKSPATYRILSQKTESGKQIPEGTLVYDTTTKTLNVALGAPFNDADPLSVFVLNNTNGLAEGDNTAEVKIKTKNTKIKSKVTFYTATKLEPVTENTQDATNPATDQQQQQNDQNQQSGQQQQQEQK